MKKNCEIIKDLLPLYLDKVCSKESSALVEEHLHTCKECQNYLESLKGNVKVDNKIEKKSIKDFAKKINCRIIMIVALCIGIFIVGFLGIRKFCNSYKYTVPYDERMSLIVLGEEKDWNFMFLSPMGSSVRGVHRKIEDNGAESNLIFLSQKATISLYLASKGSYSGGGNVPELNYGTIDLSLPTKVYYTMEDLDKVKNANAEELEEIIKDAHLMFTKETKTTRINCQLDDKDYEYSLTYYKVSDQIVDSVENDYLPGGLSGHVYSIYGDYDSVWFIGEKASDVFKKTEDYMVSNGGSCIKTDIE